MSSNSNGHGLEPPPIKPRVPIRDLQSAFHYTDTMSRRATRDDDPYEYLSGWGNEHQSEVIPGTLPQGQISPQEGRFGLYTEGLTYSAFIAPRQHNVRSFVYRTRPSMAHKGYLQDFKHNARLEHAFLTINPNVEMLYGRSHFTPFPLPGSRVNTDFVDGLYTLCGSGDPNLREGIAQSVYMINQSMDRRALCNADGDILVVPQLGSLDVQTEMGLLFVQPGEIFVIPRGLRYAIRLGPGVKEARGYVTEIWGSRWELPDLGPVGGNGLANARDFLYPVAYMDENLHEDWEIVYKSNGKYHAIAQDHSPFDVAAWHGNNAPYKYDLMKFSSQHSVAVDHTDPSIYVVLTAKSHDPHTALVDFLRIGPRWDVATNTYRRQYFHRNAASEFTAAIYGGEPGDQSGYSDGGASVEVSHTPHGSITEDATWEMRNQVNEPRIILEGTMLFMVETSRSLLFTDYARNESTLQEAGGYEDFDRLLPDKFSAYPGIKDILHQVQVSKKARKEQADNYAADDYLQKLIQNM